MVTFAGRDAEQSVVRTRIGAEGWSLTIVPDAVAMSAAAADIVADVLRARPHAVISLPTGSTPLGMFDVLAARSSRGEIDFSDVELFCLDDYLGVSPDDPNSLTGWLWRSLIARVNIDPARVHAVPATAADPDRAAADYERALAARGGLDLAVLGMGANGHIAFNEPGSSADSRTRVVTLAPETVAQGSGYWDDTTPVPHRAMTVGVGTLLEARRIVLIVSGENKAEALRRALEESMSAEVPASWLRLAGSRLEVIADEDAARELMLARVD
jgi:glucosamine-6-phosphate deaminase